MNEKPPVVLPVVAPASGPSRPPRPRARGLVVAVGGALAAVAVFAAVRPLLSPSAGPSPFEPRLLPAGSEDAVAATRDRLVRGLLSLRRPEGDFSTRDDAMEIHPSDRADATWMAIAGLSAARRMGSAVPGLSEAIDGAKAVALKRKTSTTMSTSTSHPKRGIAVSAVASAILALSLSRQPEDEASLDQVGRMLAVTSTYGSLPQGWVQGVTARAMAELCARGRAGLLVPSPVSAIPTRPLSGKPYPSDSFVAEALAEEIQRGLGASPTALPPAVFERVLADGPKWVGEQTDLDSWLLAAWLAARRPDGATWFARAWKELEAVVPEDGVVAGEYYGYPVRRTAAALLLLWEGSGQRRRGDP